MRTRSTIAFVLTWLAILAAGGAFAADSQSDQRPNILWKSYRGD